MLNRRRYMSGNGSSVYKVYDWLLSENQTVEASLTPYIVTDIIPNSSTLTRVYVRMGNVGGSTMVHIFGCRTAYSTESYVLRLNMANNGTAIPTKLEMMANSYDIFSGSVYYPSSINKIVMNGVGGVYLNDNMIISQTLSVSTQYPMYLGAANNASVSIMANRYASVYFYGFVVSHNGIERFNMIPCQLLQDTDQTWDGNTHYAGECGMWDMVTDAFYGNANLSGSFSVGND